MYICRILVIYNYSKIIVLIRVIDDYEGLESKMHVHAVL